MNIPSRVNPFGYDNTTPPGYVRAEFLENSNASTFVQIDNVYYIDEVELDILPLNAAYDVIRSSRNNYRQTITIRDGIYTVCPGDNNPSEYTSRVNCVPGERVKLKSNYKNITFAVDGEKKVLSRMFDISKSIEAIPQRMPFGNLQMRNYGAKLVWGENEISLIPALDPSGEPCMYDTITDQPFRNSGTGADFIVGLTTKQAISLANLPATGGSLTISIPLEAAFDANVESALETAAAKGWTITVQYRESEVTTKNIAADFLESTGSQVIDTGIVPTNETGLRLTALTMSDTDTIPFGSRNSNNTESRFYAIRPRRLRTGSVDRLVANGYGWGTWQTIGESTTGSAALIKKEETYLNWFNNRKASSDYGENELATLPFIPELSVYLFAANISNSASLYYIGRIWNAAVSVGTSLKANFVPAIDASGTPCMHDTVSGQNFYNANTATSFIVGFDTTEKAAISLSKLPVTTAGELTVSLPAEAGDTDTLVPAAIDIAKSRGWTIIEQRRTN